MLAFIASTDLQKQIQDCFCQTLKLNFCNTGGTSRTLMEGEYLILEWVIL